MYTKTLLTKIKHTKNEVVITLSLLDVKWLSVALTKPFAYLNTSYEIHRCVVYTADSYYEAQPSSDYLTWSVKLQGTVEYFELFINQDWYTFEVDKFISKEHGDLDE